MALFEDKKFEEMDWLAKAIEPVLSPLNDILAQLPERTEFPKERLVQMFEKGSYNTAISMETFFNAMAKDAKVDIPRNKREKICECFRLEQTGDLVFKGGSSIEIEGPGSIVMLKTKAMFEEDELLKTLGQDGFYEFNNIRDDGDGVLERVNEILDLIEGTDQLKSSRSTRKKIFGLKDKLKEIMTENKWKIKNTELADKVIVWIVSFIKDGNLAALTNFCKFKVMTHDGEAIYSIEEEAL